MTDLRSALRDRAAEISPHADLDDVMSRIERRRRHTRTIGVIACAALVGAAAVGVVALRRDHVATSSTPATPQRIAAIAVDAGSADTSLVGRSLERLDDTAVDGPWSVVARSPGGSLGKASAIVTYPVDAPTALATRVDVGSAHGFGGRGLIVWPIGDGWARVRGDLTEVELLRVATATTIVDGLPMVRDLAGFAIGDVQTYRPTTIDEVRYGSKDLGQVDTLGDGMTYTGILSGGIFEDQLFETNGRTGYTVQGHPAVVSSVNGGNGTIAWEPTPGVVAYVGYSGVSMNDIAIAALVGLAERTTPLTPEQWSATVPDVSPQPNGPVPDTVEAVPGS